jgi:hypothetical protein
MLRHGAQALAGASDRAGRVDQARHDASAAGFPDEICRLLPQTVVTTHRFSVRFVARFELPAPIREADFDREGYEIAIAAGVELHLKFAAERLPA